MEEAFLRRILAPYREHCRYLRAVTVHPDPSHPDSVRGEGTFTIPVSCYIDDTGHFNAVEFNICYNQLAYVLFGACVQHGLLAAATDLTLDWFSEKQLASMLIVKLTSSFKRPINPRRFYGMVRLDRMSRRVRGSHSTYFLSTTCAFYDDGEGLAEGAVTLACVNP